MAIAFDYRLKQAGQLPSKMRFLAAQWSALLKDGLWLRNARHANDMAQCLADQLRAKAKMETLFPVQANAVFVRLAEEMLRGLRKRGWQFYDFLEPGIYRLMCSWATADSDVDRFVSDVVCIRKELSV